MKLNPDCIRDILLFVEKHITGDNYLGILHDGDLSTEIPGYSKKELDYHFQQCENFGFILCIRKTLGEIVRIRDLSPEGHIFLANIRENTTWNKTKEIASKIGTVSLDSLQQIASNVVSSLIANHFK